jgi:hypothetical protein
MRVGHGLEESPSARKDWSGDWARDKTTYRASRLQGWNSATKVHPGASSGQPQEAIDYGFHTARQKLRAELAGTGFVTLRVLAASVFVATVFQLIKSAELCRKYRALGWP